MITQWFVTEDIGSVANDVTVRCTDRDVSTIGLFALEDIEVVEVSVISYVPKKSV